MTTATHRKRLFRHMYSAFFLAIWCLAVVVACDAPDHAHPDNAKTDVGNSPCPTIEQARGALAAMLETMPEGVLRETLRPLKEGKPVDMAECCVLLGPWRCDLRKKTFSLISDGPSAFVMYGGDFLRGPDGTWKAMLTRRAESPRPPTDPPSRSSE